MKNQTPKKEWACDTMLTSTTQGASLSSRPRDPAHPGQVGGGGSASPRRSARRKGNDASARLVHHREHRSPTGAGEDPMRLTDTATGRAGHGAHWWWGFLDPVGSRRPRPGVRLPGEGAKNPQPQQKDQADCQRLGDAAVRGKNPGAMGATRRAARPGQVARTAARGGWRSDAVREGRSWRRPARARPPGPPAARWSAGMMRRADQRSGCPSSAQYPSASAEYGPRVTRPAS
jgi:hypothetical protein